MGVSSTRVGDHRGSARTVQFSIKFLYLMICILRSARICVSDTVIPTLLSRTLRALCLLPCVKALAYTPRCVLPCNCWAGSGLPFPWGFDSTTALPLHNGVFISFLHSPTHHLQSLDTSHHYFSFLNFACSMSNFPFFLLPRSIVSLSCVTHKPSSLPSYLTRTFVFSAKVVSF